MFLTRIDHHCRILKKLLEFFQRDDVPVTVTGKVVDEQGAPMAGVTIIERGGGESDSEFPNATITNADGTYSITLDNPETAVLNFHFVGMATESVRIDGRRVSRRVVNVTMEEFRDEVTNMVNRNTDWFSALYRNAVTHRHSLSVSGGNDQTTYYASLGVDCQPGTAREERVDSVLKARVMEAAPYENVYTLALRGLHDKAMSGNEDMDARKETMQRALPEDTLRRCRNSAPEGGYRLRRDETLVSRSPAYAGC